MLVSHTSHHQRWADQLRVLLHFPPACRCLSTTNPLAKQLDKWPGWVRCVLMGLVTAKMTHEHMVVVQLPPAPALLALRR